MSVGVVEGGFEASGKAEKPAEAQALDAEERQQDGAGTTKRTRTRRRGSGLPKPPCLITVSVAGNSIVGDRASDLPWERAAAVAYGAVLGGSGQGVAGDGTVPLEAAHWPGASLQLTLDAMHSVVVPGTALSSTSWYGSERTVDLWLGPTLDLILDARQQSQQQQQ